MNKKKLFLHVPVMDTGGQERFVSNLTTILKEDYDLKVVLFDDTTIGYPVDCEIISLQTPDTNGWGKIYTFLQQVWRMRKLIIKHKPAASISFGNRANMVNALAGAGRCQILISIRGYAALEKFANKSLKGMFWRRIIRLTDKVICVSNVMAEEFKQSFPVFKEKVYTLYNAYDVSQISRLAKQRTDIDALFQDYDVIVTVGVLRPEKGYGHLIKAFSVLRKTRNNIKLLHIGADYLHYGEKIKQLISALGLQNDVLLLGHRENPYPYCAKSKIYVLSSFSEGFPNALVEAMACGVPVIATDCKTGPREILTDCNLAQKIDGIEMADYGLIVPPFETLDDDDPTKIVEEEKNLAKAMELLLANRELAKEYGWKARKRAAEFSFARCRETFIKIVEETNINDDSI